MRTRALVVLFLALLPGVALAQGYKPGNNFRLTAGNSICFNSATCTDTIKASASSAGMVFNSGTPNSGTNVGYIFDTTNALSANTCLFSVREGGSEKVGFYNNGTGLLVTGNIAASADIAIGNGSAYRGTGSSAPIYINGGMANGASAIGLQTYTGGATYSTAGAKLVSFTNNGTEEAYVAALSGAYGTPPTDSSGTPGNATANTASGQASIAASASAITISDTAVKTTSVVIAVLQATDGTCTSVKSVVPGSNTFTINTNATCTGNTKVGWLVFNGN